MISRRIIPPGFFQDYGILIPAFPGKGVSSVLPQPIRSSTKPLKSLVIGANTWSRHRNTERQPTQRWVGRTPSYEPRCCDSCDAPASRAGHDCSTRCGQAGKRNSNASFRCMWCAVVWVTRRGSLSRVACWLLRKILHERLPQRMRWYRCESLG